MDQNLKAKAEALRALHHGGKVLVLANAWDVASARVLESAGAPAIATTSAGIAYVLGYPDGEKISREEMLGMVGRIARAVKVPVTADVESGYGPGAKEAAATANAVLEAGTVGINLEDGTEDPAHPLVELSVGVEKVGAVREAGEKAGVRLMLNARTDVYLLQVGPPASRFDEALCRARAYRQAGADCIFIPGLNDAATISRFVRELKCPINILAGPGSPTVPELQRLGVARVSLGSGPMRAAVSSLRRLWHQLQETGTYAGLDGALSHAEMNRLMQE